MGVVGLLAAFAVMFGNASGTQHTAGEAVAAQHLEVTLGSLASFRTALGQTLLVAEASPDTPAMPVLIDDARLLAAQLEQRLADTSGALADLGVADPFDPGPLLTAAAGVLAALDEADSAATTEAAAVLAAEFAALEGSLAAERDLLVASVIAAGRQAGRLATSARFMVALGIPGAALLSWAAFSRKRRVRAEMAAELEREREMNRSKDQLIANISHELRTPLTSIYAAARTMVDAEGEPDLIRELTGVVVEQSGELTRMVEDLLVSAQAGAERLALAPQEIDVPSAVAQVLGDFARTGTEVAAGCRPGTVVADPLRFRQILRNLVSNARNHGGDRIWIDGAPGGDMYRLTVADDGPGVPEEIEARLFTPFVHRGDQPLITGSVGLGLSITKLLTEAMGGAVRYTRKDGVTRFVVDLPRPPADPAPAEPPEVLAEEPARPDRQHAG